MRETHTFEAKVLWKGEKSRLIEMTIPIEGHYKFFLPTSEKVTLNCYESNGDGNWMFEVSDWWWQKIHLKDFQADD
jgi:hypothetical protein